MMYSNWLSPGTLAYVQQLLVVSKARRQTAWTMLKYRAVYC